MDVVVLDTDRVRRRTIAALLDDLRCRVSLVETAADAFFRLETRRCTFVVVGTPAGLVDAARVVAGVDARRLGVPVVRIDGPAGATDLAAAARGPVIAWVASDQAPSVIRELVARLAPPPR